MAAENSVVGGNELAGAQVLYGFSEKVNPADDLVARSQGIAREEPTLMDMKVGPTLPAISTPRRTSVGPGCGVGTVRTSKWRAAS